MDSSRFRAPLSLPANADDHIAAKTAEMTQWQSLANGVMSTPVIGVRGQQLDVSEAQDRAKGYREVIELEEAEGSQRHRRVSLSVRVIILIVVAVIDFPLMFMIASSVFNVSWSFL